LLGQIVLERKPERVACQCERFLGATTRYRDLPLRQEPSDELLRKPQRLRESQGELRRLASLLVVAAPHERRSELRCDLDDVLVRFVVGNSGESSFQARARLFQASGRPLDLGEASGDCRRSVRVERSK
jgi:hypothetical protein